MPSPASVSSEPIKLREVGGNGSVRHTTLGLCHAHKCTHALTWGQACVYCLSLIVLAMSVRISLSLFYVLALVTLPPDWAQRTNDLGLFSFVLNHSSPPGYNPPIDKDS